MSTVYETATSLYKHSLLPIHFSATQLDVKLYSPLVNAEQKPQNFYAFLGQRRHLIEHIRHCSPSSLFFLDVIHFPVDC